MYYSVGDPDPEQSLTCTATDVEDGIVVCSKKSGNVDTSTPGVYEVVYEARDNDGNVATITVNYVVIANVEPSVDIEVYYSSTGNLTGKALNDALYFIMRETFEAKNYDFAKEALQVTDRDPINENNVLLLYKAASVPSIWDGGKTWNREHVWPQSLLDSKASDTAKNSASDLHNLRAEDPGTNSSRGNKYFDWVTSTHAYSPREEVRGDIARILFYMDVMYTILKLIDVPAGENPNPLHMAMLTTLLQWHIDDPVDNFEKNRNNVIYGYQGNRNPFIDMPELVSRLYVNGEPIPN